MITDQIGLHSVLFTMTYYRKLMLHEIKVLEINTTLINANLVENSIPMKEIIIAKEKVTISK